LPLEIGGGVGIDWGEEGKFFWNDGNAPHLARDLGHIDGYNVKILEQHTHDLCILIYVNFT